MTLPRLRAPGAGKAAEPCFLADVIPANLLSSLTTEAGVSFGPHCKERVEAWRVKLEINSSDKNYVMFKIPPPHPSLKVTRIPSIFPQKEKFLSRSVLVLCVNKALLGLSLFSNLQSRLNHLLLIFPRVRGIKTQEAEMHKLQQLVTRRTPLTYCSFFSCVCGK